METASQSLVFSPSPFSVAAGAAFVAGIAVLAWMSWQRSGFRRLIGWLELLRVLIATGIAITLSRPEWREVFKPDARPTLAILHDVSRSMETRDIVDEKQPAAEPLARSDLARPFLDPKAWEPLAKRMDVVFEPFSSAQQPPAEGTDIQAALSQLMEKHGRLASVVLLSDGDWNTGEAPSQAATRLRMRETPVFTVPAGAETRLPDVNLASFDVPTFAIAGKPLRIPFTI